MSRYLEPTHDDFHEGSAPRWFRTRYKKECQDLACASANIGVLADDFGKDPAITAISTTVEGNTTNYGNCPTQKDWSSRVEAMIFRVEIENNTAGTLLVDLEFYRAVYGDSGSVEDWQKIDLEGKGLGLADGEEVVVQTDRSSIFVRIAGYTNPDSNAQLHISCMLAAVQDVDVDGEQSRIWGWCSSLGRWVKAQVSTAGRLLTSEENSTSILTKLTELDTEVDAQGLVIDSLLKSSLLNVVGRHSIYGSPVDFTATYLDADSVTLTGLPATPSNEQFLGVFEKRASGVLIPYLATEHVISLSSGVLTVSGAEFDPLGTAKYVVIYFDKARGWDAVAKAFRFIQVNARQRLFGSSSSPLSAAALTNLITGVDSGWINVKGLTEIAAWITFVTATDNGAYVLSFKMLANDTDDGTDEFDVVRGDWRYPNGAAGGAIALDHDTAFTITSTVAGGVAETDRVCVRFDVRGMDRVKFQFGTTTSPAANYGTVSLSVTTIN